jgi:hypothetical protein
MESYALEHPKGYYVVEDGRMLALCRRDGSKVWRFDPAAVLEGDVALAALEDHTELLINKGGEWLSQYLETRTRTGRVRAFFQCLKHQLSLDVYRSSEL